MTSVTRTAVTVTAVVVAALASTAAAAPVADVAPASARAGERVTLVARPTTHIPRRPPIALSGTISSATPNEEVQIQAKDCGENFFRAAAVATTDGDGVWTTRYTPVVGTVLRAVWKDAVSAPVTVRAHVDVRLQRDVNRRRGFEVAIVSKSQFWRKRVFIQRRDPRLGRWRTIKKVVLTDSGAPPGSAFVWTTAEFGLRVPRRSLLRAVFPTTQSRPCYLGGYSNSVRS